MTAPHFDTEHVTVWHGDCIDVMRGLPDASVDAVCTDPPYALEFMGKGWDTYTPLEFEAWCAEWAAECLRLLKPGGHLLAFGGTRTFHRLAAGIEDAGFEIRDSIAWLYGSGFPKSLDVSKAIDKAAGAEREVVGPNRFAHLNGKANGTVYGDASRPDETAPAAPAAAAWTGWGTALKPAFEPIVVARKPLTGTVAANVLQHGTGALNIDASRIGTTDALGGGQTSGSVKFAHEGWNRPWMDDPDAVAASTERHRASVAKAEQLGRWPANVVLDASQAAALDAQSGVLTSGANPTRRSSDKFRDTYGEFKGQTEITPARGADSGGASRFFKTVDDVTPRFMYTAKAGSDERPNVDGIAHPTVKSLDLMRWLVKLVTPKGGTVLEPFAGSGTTVEAAVLEGFRCIAIEREADYLPLIMQRMSKPHAVGLDFGDWEDAS